MRIAGLILGIVGGVAAGVRGIVWLRDAAEYRAELELATQMGFDVADFVTAAYLLLVALVLGVLGGVLALRGHGRIAGSMMLVAAVAPGLFEPKAFAFTCLLILAGLISFGARPSELASV